VLAGALALTLPWLTWPQAVLVGASGVIFNLVLLPRLMPRLFRADDRRQPLLSGIVLYPAAVLGLLLCFPSRLDLAAIGWVILAAGDGMATLVGAHVRTPRLPWNTQKSIGGLAAFVIFGSAAAISTAWWMHRYSASPDAGAFMIVTVPILATVASALVETVPIKLNDNLSVPAIAAVVLWSCSFVDPATLAAGTAVAASRVWPALGLNVAVAALGYFAKTVTPAGAIVGAAIGISVFTGTGAEGWSLLFAAFLLAAGTTRLGLRRKTAAGIAESRGGRRGAGNAIANTGLAAFAALVCLGLPDPSLARLAMATALAASASDTAASEVGKAWGRATWLVIGFRRVPPGTSGAVSAEGTTAGLIGASILAGLASVLGLVPSEWIACVVTAATVASLVESALGATLEAGGTFNNDALNFVNAAVGSGLAMACARWV
jgi:uncharacterized protein (TIGR00297 family)